MKIVVFSVDSKEYAIDIRHVREVIRLKNVVPVPDAPAFVEGIITREGKVITLVNMQKKLGIGPGNTHRQDRIIVTQSNGHLIGIVVDNVIEVLSVESADVIMPEELLKDAAYLIGIAKIDQKLILIADVEKFFTDQDKQNIKEVHEKVQEPIQVQAKLGKQGDLEMNKDESGKKQNKKKMLRVVSFTLANEHYCVEVNQTKEVIPLKEITNVPNTPEFIVGAMNLRGSIISVIDIKTFFGLAQKEKTKNTKIIITDVTGRVVGILVDKLRDAVLIEPDALQPPLVTLKNRLAACTKGQVQINNQILIVLDMEKILTCPEIEELRGYQK
ncbi:MAG: chemotaxis protein CheW [Candidatus Omnitrophota bacterium]